MLHGLSSFSISIRQIGRVSGILAATMPMIMALLIGTWFTRLGLDIQLFDEPSHVLPFFQKHRTLLVSTIVTSGIPAILASLFVVFTLSCRLFSTQPTLVCIGAPLAILGWILVVFTEMYDQTAYTLLATAPLPEPGRDSAFWTATLIARYTFGWGIFLAGIGTVCLALAALREQEWSRISIFLGFCFAAGALAIFILNVILAVRMGSAEYRFAYFATSLALGLWHSSVALQLHRELTSPSYVRAPVTA